MLNEKQLSKLAALRLYGTSYELILTNGAQKYLVAYCRKTGPGLVAALRRQITSAATRLHFIAELTGTKADDWRMTGAKSAGGGAWQVLFSGRTQREAITLGELPRVTEATASAPAQPIAA